MEGRAPKFQVILVPHVHWDREWYLPFQQFRLKLVRLMDGLLSLLDSDPRFQAFVLDGQSIILEDYLEIRPEKEGEIRQLVQTGRLQIGPWYAMPDEFLVSGESLIRNLLLGHRIAGQFGETMKVGYLPDPFGHIAQLPQILQGFGIDNVIFTRGLGDEGEWLGTEFHWAAPDGTTVLAIHQLGGYCNAANLGYPSVLSDPTETSPDQKMALDQARCLIDHLARYARTPFLLFNNGCDHLAPQPHLPELVDYLNQHLENTQVTLGTYTDFLDRVRPQAVGWQQKRGELRAARYAPLLGGVLSTRMNLKQENERTQTLLERWAEPFSALAWLEGAPYPEALLRHAWKLVLQNHPHDSICGCVVDQVYAEMMNRFAQAQQMATTLRQESLNYLASRIDTNELPQGEIGLIVFNPLAWRRSDVVLAQVELPTGGPAPGSWIVLDHSGKRLPCQVLNRKSYRPSQDSPPIERLDLSFVVENVPALGYKTYVLRRDPGGQGKFKPDELESLPPYIENEFYVVSANSDGTLQVEDKRSGYALSGLHLFEDAEDAGDEYNYSPAPKHQVITNRHQVAEVHLLTGGPGRRALSISLNLRLPEGISADRSRRSDHLVDCPIISEVSLYPKVDRIDFHTRVHNRARNHRLRVLFSSGIMADAVQAAGHFAVVARKMRPPAGRGWAEPPSRTNHHASFVDVSDGQVGLAVLSTGLPEYEAIQTDEGITIALTLLRSVGWLSRDDLLTRPGHAGPGCPTPGAQCLGEHEFEYAIRLHCGDWEGARVYQSAEEHKVPLLAVATPYHNGTLPTELSFLRLEGDGLILSCLKKTEDGDGLIIRLFNISDRDKEGRLSLYKPFKEVYLVRLDESEPRRIETAGPAEIVFTVPPRRIVTLRCNI
ncbi:MAG: glycosyl hydrolase-related protein [Chloroflexi bacterium]|nr:glycosyl hydrolase-related protein [Chloroflexota bacterium]MCL5076449.1 glycosyl hydrolase-related protein [Chloroflexota bacterium]